MSVVAYNYLLSAIFYFAGLNQQMLKYAVESFLLKLYPHYVLDVTIPNQSLN